MAKKTSKANSILASYAEDNGMKKADKDFLLNTSAFYIEWQDSKIKNKTIAGLSVKESAAALKLESLYKQLFFSCISILKLKGYSDVTRCFVPTLSGGRKDD